MAEVGVEALTALGKALLRWAQEHGQADRATGRTAAGRCGFRQPGTILWG